MFPRKSPQEEPHPAPFPAGQTRGNRGIRKLLTAGTGSLPFVAQLWPQSGLQPRLESASSRLHFNLPLRSGPGAPQTGLLPHSQRQPAARQAPSLTCASRPGPAGHPPPQAPLHPVQAQEASSGAQRRGHPGRRRLLQEAKPLTWLMRLLASPRRLRPLFLLLSNPQFSRAQAPPSPSLLRRVRLRRPGKRSRAQIESSWTI